MLSTSVGQETISGITRTFREVFGFKRKFIVLGLEEILVLSIQI